LPDFENLSQDSRVDSIIGNEITND
jgi:hypothetical protein